MGKALVLLLGLATPEYSSEVAVTAAYTIHTRAFPVPEKCCGLCKNGRIVHGDGHVTDCACPPGCKCKAKSVLECKENCKPRK